MISILIISLVFIILCLLYPAFLLVLPGKVNYKASDDDEILGISLILLTYKGEKYIKEKIKFLYNELRSFREFEFIVIDDNSDDDTQKILKSLEDTYKLRIILKQEHKGVADSMNVSALTARYDHLIFCDQRQKLSENILKKLARPLLNENIGAVSGTISNWDLDGSYSFFRKYENILKVIESKTGNLIGVYGPLYSIKRDCYVEIPGNIILDDLYLSLKVLKSKKIVLLRSCGIVDENASVLYNYKRCKRYLLGLIQIIKDKELIDDLTFRIKLMLIWHKYLRLLIPVFVFISYLILAYYAMQEFTTSLLFFAVTVFIVLVFILSKLKVHTQLGDMIQTNVYYFISIISILIDKFFSKII